MSIAKYFDLYFKLISAGVRAQPQYRFAFVMRIVGLITSYTGTAVTMWIMLYQFQELGSWTFYEMLFLFAVAVLSWGFCIILFFHFRGLDTYILNGTFDRFLVRPINPFFHFMAMKFDVASFGQFIFSIGIFIWVSFEAMTGLDHRKKFVSAVICDWGHPHPGRPSCHDICPRILDDEIRAILLGGHVSGPESDQLPSGHLSESRPMVYSFCDSIRFCELFSRRCHPRKRNAFFPGDYRVLFAACRHRLFYHCLLGLDAGFKAI